MTRRINGDALENRAGTAATGDVFTFNDAHVDGGVWQAPGAGSQAFPVGSIFLAAVSTNPATLLGYGTWSAIGAGRVLIGIDAGDADFDTLGETGGAKTKAISGHAGTAVADHAAHAHTAGTLVPSAHSGTAVDAHSGTGVDAHSGATVADHSGASLSHIHTFGTIAVAAHTAHTHTGGTYTVADHSHSLSGVVAHSHTIAAGQGSHFHGELLPGTATGALVGCTPDATTSNSTVSGYNTASATLPAMSTDSQGSATATGTYSGAAPSLAGSSGNPSASLTHSVSGNTNDNGPATLTHSVGQPSNHIVTQPAAHVVTQPATHTMNGSTSSDALSAHGVTQPNAHSDLNVLQPYLVVAIWQRTA